MMQAVDDVNDLENQDNDAIRAPLIPRQAEPEAAGGESRLKIVSCSLISSACLAGSAVAEQAILSKYAGPMGFLGMAMGIVPTGSPSINWMYSQDLKNLHTDPAAPGNVRNTFWTYVLTGSAIGFLSIPLIYYSPAVLKLLGAGDLSAEDTAAVRATLNYEWPGLFLDNFINAYLTLLYQSRHVGLATAVVAADTLSGLLITYLAANYSDLGLQTYGVSDLSSSLIGLATILYIEKTWPVAKQSIFNFSSLSSESWRDKGKILAKKSGLNWLGELFDGVVSIYAGNRFSSVGVQGMLGVLEGACENVTGVTMDVFAPDISENVGQTRKDKIKKQFLYGMLPMVAFTIPAVLLAEPLSNALGGGLGAISSADLRMNVALFMGGALLSNLYQILYQTFMDCGITNIPALTYMLSSAFNLALCFGVNQMMSGENVNIVGNIAALGSTLLALTCLGGYSYQKRATLFYDQDQEPEAVGLPEVAVRISPIPPARDDVMEHTH